MMTTINLAAHDLILQLELSGMPPELGIESLALALVCLVKGTHGPEQAPIVFADLVERMRESIGKEAENVDAAAEVDSQVDRSG